MIRFFVTVILASAFSTPSFASRDLMIQDFEALRYTEHNYVVFGTVCEQVAKRRLEKMYPAPEYSTTVGIGYWNKTRQLGELDVIVFRNSDEEAVIVAEVKCWNDLPAALKKANRQLSRFTGHIAAGTKLKMSDMDDRSHEYSRTQFDEHPREMRVSQDGGLDHGFEMVIGLSMAEVKTLRQMIMDCQNQDKCDIPAN